MRRLVAPLLALLLLAGWAPAHQSVGPPPDSQDVFDQMVEEYLAFHFYFNPVEATVLGVHAYDGRLPDLSQESLFSLIAAYHGWLERVQSVDRETLGGDAYWDHRILEHGIRHRLLELEEIRGWEGNPLYYVNLVTRALEPLVAGRFSTDVERMRAVMARERQLPRLLAQARANLLDPPPVATELAVESARGAARFVRDEVPRAFEGVPAGQEKDRFERINRQTVEELRSFAAWLEADLLSDAEGDFRHGADLFRRLLLTREHVDVPVGDLLTLVDDEVERYRRWIEAEARELDPSRPPDEVIGGIGRDGSEARALPGLAEARMEEVRDFLARKDLLTLPEGPVPDVAGTPPFHVGPAASLVASGAFEGREALSPRLLLELPGSGWSDADRRAHLGLLAPPALLGVTAREAYPGRWVQALHLREVPSRIRQVFQPETLTRGWGLYAEEMLLDRGFGDGDSALRIAQLRWALAALARLQAGIRMHVEGASVSEGARLLQEVAYLDPFPALRQARRLSVAPLPGSGALGKLQISRLRSDYREHLGEEGETYVLANFHDRFLRTGTPASLARRILIPGDERPSLSHQR